MTAETGRGPAAPEERGGLTRSPWISRGIALGALVAAAIMPLFFDSGGSFVEDCTVALAYVVMALGLNIVVGFAGLLDLGYVAFFAVGAYTIGWFASGFYAQAGGGTGIHIGVGGNAAALPGVHLNFLLVVVIAVVLTITTIASLVKVRRDPSARAHAGSLRARPPDRGTRPAPPR